MCLAYVVWRNIDITRTYLKRQYKHNYVIKLQTHYTAFKQKPYFEDNLGG